MNVDPGVLELQRELLDMLGMILAREVTNVEAPFVELGAGSVVIIQLYALIEQRYPGEITLQEVFDNGSVAALARHLQARRTAKAGNEGGGGHVDF